MENKPILTTSKPDPGNSWYNWYGIIGYNVAAFFPGGIEHPDFGLLKLTPWRIELGHLGGESARLVSLAPPDNSRYSGSTQRMIIELSHRIEETRRVFNVCSHCGEYAVEKMIDPAGPFAICPFCTYAHPFLQQPLFLITGASGAGKQRSVWNW